MDQNTLPDELRADSSGLTNTDSIKSLIEQNERLWDVLSALETILESEQDHVINSGDVIFRVRYWDWLDAVESIKHVHAHEDKHDCRLWCETWRDDGRSD